MRILQFSEITAERLNASVTAERWLGTIDNTSKVPMNLGGVFDGANTINGTSETLAPLIERDSGTMDHNKSVQIRGKNFHKSYHNKIPLASRSWI